ncbi:MAG: hypothetical protein AAFZ58_05685 [Pseudomonadota bacterium]
MSESFSAVLTAEPPGHLITAVPLTLLVVGIVGVALTGAPLAAAVLGVGLIDWRQRWRERPFASGTLRLTARTHRDEPIVGRHVLAPGGLLLPGAALLVLRDSLGQRRTAMIWRSAQSAAAWRRLRVLWFSGELRATLTP